MVESSRVVVFVGGSRGIGQAAVTLLRQQGQVVLTADRSKSASLYVDLASLDSVRAFCGRVAQLEAVAVLVFNAACCLPAGCTSDGYDRTVQVNFIACMLISFTLRNKLRLVYVVTHPLLGQMFRLTPGSLVSFNDSMLLQYFRSKSELLRLQTALLKMGGVVTSVYPGVVHTGLAHKLPAALKYTTWAIAAACANPMRAAAAAIAQSVHDQLCGRTLSGALSSCVGLGDSEVLDTLVSQLFKLRLQRNWSGNLLDLGEATIAPQTVVELQYLLKSACRQGKQVRFTGSLYSQSILWLADQRPTVTISLQKLNAIVGLAPGTIQVQAGATLSQIDQLLRARKRSLLCFAGVCGQSVAGAVATGTHGFGLERSCTAATLQSMQLVDGRGTVRTVSGKYAVHLGALGAVFQVAMETCELYLVKTSVSAAPEDALDEIVENCLYSWFPLVNRVIVTSHEIEQAPASGARFNTVYGNAFNELKCWITWLLVGSWWLPFAFRSLVLRIFFVILQVGSSLQLLRYTGLPREQFTHRFMAPVVNDIEFSFSKSQYKNVLQKMRDIPGVLRAAALINIRLALRDDCCLSMCNGRESVFISLMFPPQDPQLAHRVEQIFREVGGRPHWGKWTRSQQPKNDYIRAAWSQEQIDDFQQLKMQLDPATAFYSPFGDTPVVA